MGRRMEIKLEEASGGRIFGVLPTGHRVIRQSKPEIRSSKRNMTGYRRMAASRLRAPQREADAFRSASLCESVSQNRRQQSQLVFGEDRLRRSGQAEHGSQQPLAAPDPDAAKEHGDLCRLKHGWVRVPSRCVNSTGRRVCFQLNERTVLLVEDSRWRSRQCTARERTREEHRCPANQGVIGHARIIGYPHHRVYTTRISEKTEQINCRVTVV